MADVIVALGTALETAGIAVVRMSGDGCAAIADTLFSARIPVSRFEPRKLMLGSFRFDDTADRALCVRFCAPHSYTGEDVVEFQLHGGVRLATRALEACIEAGCRLAQPGEFTRRAYLNGKLTLAQAEGLAEAISASSDAELRAALATADGALGKRIGAIAERLVDLTSGIEVAIDYPEEDVEVAAADLLRASAGEALADVERLLATRRTGKIVAEGLTIALVGKPNVGKSSLLNALSGTERAIVTPRAGTTRDTLTESVQYRGIRLTFCDTAGLRESEDDIERIGVERARKAARSCDLALLVTDNTFGPEDEAIRASLDVPTLVVANKADLGAGSGDIRVSAKTGEGLEALLDRIVRTYADEGVVTGGVLLTNARHAAALTEARDALRRAMRAPEPALMTADLRDAIAALGKIDGSTVSADVTDAIFSKFCLGK